MIARSRAKRETIPSHFLRVAFVAGTLEQDGAEKQLVYMAAALRRVGVDVRVYSLTRGEFYEPALKAVGVTPIWIGRFGNPLIRLAALTNALWRFRPHIVQAGHFFTNIYAAISAQLCRAISIGAIRNDLIFEQKENGRWSPWLLRLPSVLLANSTAAARHADELGFLSTAVRVLPNAIDLADFDERVAAAHSPARSGSQIISVGRLVHAKRQDHFLEALAQVRQHRPGWRGVLLGDGPLRPELESQAARLGLLPYGVLFAGRRDDVPALLHQSEVFVLTSDHEGFPNVLLEAMAARLPVVTTPAGDSPEVVQNGRTGFVVALGDKEALVERIVRLADSAELRRRLGEAGRKRAEELYGSEHLAERLLAVYRDVALERGRKRLSRDIEVLAASHEVVRRTSEASPEDRC
jgi:glycosyltransferase involved in cell wall biosynthesis